MRETKRRGSIETETVSHGAIDFHDPVEVDTEDSDAAPFHRLDLTEGETAVLRNALAYVQSRFRAGTAGASAAVQVDFLELCRKANEGPLT